MKQYTKAVKVNAKPMTRGEWCDYRRIQMSVDENPLAAGYFVEHINSEKINDSRHSEFIEWIPASEFLRHYSEF